MKKLATRFIEKRQPRSRIFFYVERDARFAGGIKKRQPRTPVGVQRERYAHPSSCIPNAQAVGDKLDASSSRRIAENHPIQAEGADLQRPCRIGER